MLAASGVWTDIVGFIFRKPENHRNLPYHTYASFVDSFYCMSQHTEMVVFSLLWVSQNTGTYFGIEMTCLFLAHPTLGAISTLP
jgi:hypothetical protein